MRTILHITEKNPFNLTLARPDYYWTESVEFFGETLSFELVIRPLEMSMFLMADVDELW